MDKLDLDSVLTFGKYRGKTLKEVFDLDIYYLVWCLENITWFNVSQDAEDIIYTDYFNYCPPEFS